MKLVKASAASAIMVTALGASTACSTAQEESGSRTVMPDLVLAPTSATVSSGADFHDAAGRLWTCTGKVTFQKVDPDAVLKSAPRVSDSTTPSQLAPTAPPTVQELAEMLRPTRLVGEYEYRLAEPDTLLAQKILDMKTAPGTASHGQPSAGESAPPSDPAAVKPRFIIYSPYDDRTAYFPGAASAVGHISQNCTMALIGPSTGLSAAHCFYQNGSWISGGVVAMAARNYGPYPSSASTPNGTYNSDSVTLPGAWVSGAGATGAVATAAAHSGWDWDFAVLEFSPTRYPGNALGWFGTNQYLASGYTQNIVGYPVDKLYRSQWRVNNGYYSSQSGSRFLHSMDIWGGESGACIYHYTSPAGYDCTGIQSSMWVDGSGNKWNEARMWDATTHNFFDAYGNWP